jgi:hypothetical protein
VSTHPPPASRSSTTAGKRRPLRLAEEARDPSARRLVEWTMRRAGCVASATGRLSGSSRARQRPVNSCPVLWPSSVEQGGTCPLSRGGSHVFSSVVGRCRPSPIPGDNARPSCRPGPTEQGPPVPGRSAHGRRDRRGHAPGRRHSSRPADARSDRCAVARGHSDHEALTLTETDLNERRGSLLIRHGKGDRRREVHGHGRSWPTGPRTAPSCRRARCSA